MDPDVAAAAQSHVCRRIARPMIASGLDATTPRRCWTSSRARRRRVMSAYSVAVRRRAHRRARRLGGDARAPRDAVGRHLASSESPCPNCGDVRRRHRRGAPRWSPPTPAAGVTRGGAHVAATVYAAPVSERRGGRRPRGHGHVDDARGRGVPVERGATTDLRALVVRRAAGTSAEKRGLRRASPPPARAASW